MWIDFGGVNAPNYLQIQQSQSAEQQGVAKEVKICGTGGRGGVHNKTIHPLQGWSRKAANTFSPNSEIHCHITLKD